MNNNTFDIFGVSISTFSIYELTAIIDSSIINKQTFYATYTTANTLNLIYKNHLAPLFNKFTILFPDGTGTHWALKYLYPSKYIGVKMTGSDLFPEVLNLCNSKGYKIFLYGENEITINKAKLKIMSLYPALNCIFNEGYSSRTEDVIKNVNSFAPDVLAVLTGSPSQENFVANSINKLNVQTIICFGAALKIFSGEKKRGPKILWNLGLEWLLRLITEPKLWKRYLVGIPVFLFRVIKEKRKIK